MAHSTARIVHTEVMQLEVPPDRVREFILTPDRILDYYPDPIEGGVLEPGRAIYCRGQIGVSLLERIDAESSEDRIVLAVTTAIGAQGATTREEIEAAATFRMVEDWEIAPHGSGTTLTKTWRDVEAVGAEPFPLAEAVREGAIHESPQLVRAWNEAATRQASGS